VHYGEGKTETYKYKYLHNLKNKYNCVLEDVRRRINTLIQKIKRATATVDWRKAIKDSFTWVIEAGIEGLTANFATHALFNVPFNLETVLAHGIIIKQGLDVYWRLRKNGATPKIPDKQN
jgi:hypothetical protein